MIHRENIEGYPGTLTQLASEVGDLRYDALADFLRAIATKLEADGMADEGRHRPKLASALRDAGKSVAVAAADVERAWSICAPRM